MDLSNESLLNTDELNSGQIILWTRVIFTIQVETEHTSYVLCVLNYYYTMIIRILNSKSTFIG